MVTVITITDIPIPRVKSVNISIRGASIYQEYLHFIVLISISVCESRGIYDPFYKNMICSIFLAFSDLLGFVISLYLSLGILSFSMTNFSERVPDDQVASWIILHWLLGLCCVAWYGIRLRHYFYRKTFWFELKEILRTLIIFAVIEMAVMAFAKWYFSRYVWLLTWVLVIILVPLLRIATKIILNKLGLWLRETWIIGSGKMQGKHIKRYTVRRIWGWVL